MRCFSKILFHQLLDKKEPGYVTYSKIDLLPAKSALPRRIRFHCCITAGQVFPVIKRLQNFLYWSINYYGPIHYSFIEYLVKWLVYLHKNHNLRTSINDVRHFLAIFDLPTYLVLPYNIQSRVIFDTPYLL